MVPPSESTPALTISPFERPAEALPRPDQLIGVGVVGYGYWGPNLVRNFGMTPGARMVAVSDLSPNRLASVQTLYPAVKTTPVYEDLLSDPEIDAIAIATPVSSHFRLAMQALEAGKHVLVEKPLALNSGQAALLVEEAERRDLVLMVDHTFVYHGSVRRIRELIDSGQVGKLRYFDSTRVN